MCGILTCVSRKSGLDSKVIGALRLLSHRGPDSRNIYLQGESGNKWLRGLHETPLPGAVDLHRFNIAMGHARLSIIDLGKGSDQPMASDDGDFVISFNGEIYNYIELRERLESCGESFRTGSDTEVLLKSLVRSGVDALREMNGMWAFTLLDVKKKRLVLSRDRYGKKPLFYYNGPDYFIAASEIKSIFHILGTRRALNPDFLSAFISFNFWPNLDDGRTLYRDIKCLEAGSVLVYDIETQEVSITRNNAILDFASAPADGRDLADDIGAAVRLRLRADVPVGVLVSGGVDSSTVAACARLYEREPGEIAWYAGDTGVGNDMKFASLLADSMGVELRKVEVRSDISTEMAGTLTYHYEMPLLFLGNSIAMFQMYQRIAADGVKVVLDGTGADEIFGGYFDHYNRGILKTLAGTMEMAGLCGFICSSVWHGNISAKRMFKDALSQFAGALAPSGGLAGSRRKYKNLNANEFLYREKDNPSGGNGGLGLIEIQRHDMTRGRLPNWLYMNDQNSLINSVEVRSPFLDYRLAKYINLPVSSKYRDGYNKYELRNSMPPAVSDAIRWRRDKQGFRLSPMRFLQANGREIKEAVSGSAIISKLFEKEKLERNLNVESVPEDGSFYLRLYSVALLESTFDCSL